jgi:hypothetical protein
VLKNVVINALLERRMLKLIGLLPDIPGCGRTSLVIGNPKDDLAFVFFL